jgi:Cdc6-like AAA superfamily ATPase
VFERYTDQARSVVVRAQEEARRLNHNYIGTEHILLGLIREGESIAAEALESLGISLNGVREQVEEIIGQGQQAPSGHIPFTPRVKKVLELSLRESLQLGHNYIGPEHILLGLIREGDGFAVQVLVKLGVDLNRLRIQVIQLLYEYQGKEPATEQHSDRPTLPTFEPVLDQIAENITSASLPEPLISRDKELELVIQALSQRTRNSPILVGESYAGRTAILNGLVRSLRSHDVPAGLQGKKIYIISNALLMAAGSAAFEKILKEVQARDDVILYIDELDDLLASDESSGSAAVVRGFKVLLSRGKLQIIGATTPDQYRRYLERDTLLKRSLHVIYLPELTVAEIAIALRSSRNELQSRFNIRISDEALLAAAALALHLTRGSSPATTSTDSLLTLSLLEAHKLDKASDFDQEIVSVARYLLEQALNKAIPRESIVLAEQLETTRREKDEAINSQDLEKAAELRDKEKEILRALRAARRLARGITIDDEVIFVAAGAATGLSIGELREQMDEFASSASDTMVTSVAAQPYVLLNDEPLKGPKGDLLDTDNIASGIASLLANSRSEAPFVLALDASWGMGKSTLLRQIESRLLDLQGVATVRFNAWTAREANALEGLIKAVLVELDPNIIRRWARRVSSKRRILSLARIGSAVFARFFGVTRMVDELWSQLAIDARTRNQLRDVIQDMLSDWINGSGQGRPKRALVVFVDDLDRCTDEVIVKVCEAIKLYLDAPGLIFVLACDLSVIARGTLALRAGNESEGRSYLEKIVQVVYRLPPPDEGQLNELILGYARQSGTTALIDRAVVRIMVESAGSNPRRIKRIINSIVLENRLNPAWSLPPLSRAQLVTAILLQHLYSSFYELLIDEGSGKDPIGVFLDYVDIRLRVSSPPSAGNEWWEIVERIFREYNMPAADRSEDGSDRLREQLEQLEQKLPGEFPSLARNNALVGLLRGIGDASSRIALRSELVRRPLGAESLLELAPEDQSLKGASHAHPPAGAG